ncbi:D-arabinono-1,4-lactone oxidase [Herbidospora sp. NBRC 101105]|uniref:D-arabinono-1,4-lactone oxidase n=1 Tax=Herbidospora sp. NBRC 101105 TaxID=3032195 RepID=UPI0024A073C8|nr:D-arabinono-1,4-lactone oxidase [Herbidospora sp. NBRC 101105]GLX94401.1 FAD-linked oxidoreductase [Herbidospora sp. NBRC 101105]
MTFTNWAGNQSITPAETRTPRSPAEVAEAVTDAKRQGRTVRMIGTGHSFTGVALTDGIMLRPEGLTGILSFGDGTVTVAAGTPIHVLNVELDRRGLALANMGDITLQTVAGAVQTGTHGSGRSVGGLADQVTALDLVLADGSAVTVSEGDLFDAARVGLGALGVVTAVTFRVEPAFLLRNQRSPMRFDEILDALDTITLENEHLDFFWLPHTDLCLVKRNNRAVGGQLAPGRFRTWLDDVFVENTLFGVANRVGARFPSIIPPVNRLSGTVLGTSETCDTAYKVFTSVREVRFLETEWAIPRRHLADALREVRALVERSPWRISFPVEVRVTPPSTAWLSTAYDRDSAYIACHVYRRTPNPGYFAAVEEIMTGLDGRPHWGKMHNTDATYLSQVYPRFRDFVALRDRVDPDRLFANAYLDRVLGA